MSTALRREVPSRRILGDSTVRDEKGEEKDVVMGSYGIGLGRVMATAVEVYHDEKGILWSEALAPFKVHLVELEGGDGVGIYKDLQKNHVEVLFDDREVSAGEKFAEADLLGMPWRLVTSKKTEGKVEVKKRGEEKSEVMEIEEFVKQLKM